MSTSDRLPAEALDGLLDGSPSAEAAGTPLAAYLDAVRHRAAATRPAPSDELRMVLVEGLDPSVDRAPQDAQGTTAPGWRSRGRLALRVVVTKFAALGLVAKAAAGAAAVTVAASGAGAAGLLPPPAQTTFDDVIGREAAPADAEEDEDDVHDSTDAGDTRPTTPADSPTTTPLETDVSDDATGTADRQPGVDGREVADDASEGRRAPAGRAPGTPPAGERTDDTPAADVVDDTPASESRAEQGPPRQEGDTGQAQQAERERAERERAEQERAEQERAEQERAEQERAEQERAEQERAEQQRVEEGTEQGRVEQRPAAPPSGQVEPGHRPPQS